MITDVRVNNEYVLVKDKDDGSLILCEFMVGGRIETIHDVSVTADLDEITEGWGLPEDFMLLKNRIYKIDGQMICPADDINYFQYLEDNKPKVSKATKKKSGK